MSSLKTKKQYEIHYYDLNANKKANVITITNWFQDLFVYQSHAIGLGFDYYSNQNLTWMVLKWDIKISKYPSYMEKITVKMEPLQIKKFFLYIKFQILNEQNEIIVDAISLWVLIDTKKILPHKVPKEVLDIYQVNNENNINIDKIQTLDSFDSEKIFNVHYSDIDTNGHVNNSKYISWAFDTLPEHIIKNNELLEININYKKNTNKCGNLYSSIKMIDSHNDNIMKFSHKIYTEDNSILAVMESTWSNK